MRNAVGDINSLEIDLDDHLQCVAEVVSHATQAGSLVDVEMARVREQMVNARDRLARARA
jgi:hypothetical protein